MLKSAAEVKEMFASVSRTAGAYTSTVQEAAVQCIGHAIAHGDVTLASTMLSHVRGHDKATLVAFFEKHGPFRYQKDSAAFEKNKSFTGEFKPETIPNWEKAKKVPEIKSEFDVDAALDQFLKRCHTQVKAAKSVKDAALIAELEAVQTLFNAKKIRQKQAEELAKLAESQDLDFTKPALVVNS